ncbi:MAG: histidine kinase [Flavobacterium sp. BFFFF2]|nr:MAG: histidine kinase [Flavobacterium sp. BFFFF2]
MLRRIKQNVIRQQLAIKEGRFYIQLVNNMNHLMKKVCLILFIFLVEWTYAQPALDTIPSKILNENRLVSVSLPASYKRSREQKYPLLIVLDAEYMFDAFHGPLSYANYWDDLPEMIIVGIHQNRNKERESDCKIEPSTGLPEEEGANFFEFLGGELITYLQKQYRVGSFKIVSGVGLTGAFTNFYLYKDQPIFNAYISFGQELMPEMETRVPARLAVIPQNIFYYHSSADGDLPETQKRLAQMDSLMNPIKKPNIFYRYDKFKDASHYSQVLHGVPNALYHIFSVYQPISITEYKEKLLILNKGYVDYLTNKYQTIETTFGMKFNIRASDFRAVEAAIVSNNAFDELKKLSELARKHYPKAMLADYLLAVYYERTGDNKKAIKSFNNAFFLTPIGDLTKDMMMDRANSLK